MIINSKLIQGDNERQEICYRNRPEGSNLTHSIIVKNYDENTYLITIKCAFMHNLLDTETVTIEYNGTELENTCDFSIIDDRSFSFKVRRYQSIAAASVEYVPNREQIFPYYRSIYPRYINDSGELFKVKINDEIYRARLLDNGDISVLGTEKQISTINGDSFSFDDFEIFEFTEHGSLTIKEGIRIYYSCPYFSVPINLDYNTNYDGRNEEIFRYNIVNTLMDSINYESTKVEKSQFVPYVVSDGKYIPADRIEFNLHFRDRRGIDDAGNISDEISSGWTTNEALGWNCFDFQYEKQEDDSIIEKLVPQNESYSEWMSDKLDYLGFTASDIRYQRKKLGKSFLRLCFYNSQNPLDRQLLFYTTIFTDTGELAGKYQKLKSHGEVVFAERYENDDERLSSRFYVTNKYNDDRSSEGFYLYLFPEDLEGYETEDESEDEESGSPKRTHPNIRNAEAVSEVKAKTQNKIATNVVDSNVTYSIIRFNIDVKRDIGAGTDKDSYFFEVDANFVDMPFDPVTVTSGKNKGMTSNYHVGVSLLPLYNGEYYWSYNSQKAWEYQSGRGATLREFNSGPLKVLGLPDGVSFRMQVYGTSKKDSTIKPIRLTKKIEKATDDEIEAITGFADVDDDGYICVYAKGEYTQMTVEITNFKINFPRQFAVADVGPKFGVSASAQYVDFGASTSGLTEMLLSVTQTFTQSMIGTYQVNFANATTCNGISTSMPSSKFPLKTITVSDGNFHNDEDESKTGIWWQEVGWSYSKNNEDNGKTTITILENSIISPGESLKEKTVDTITEDSESEGSGSEDEGESEEEGEGEGQDGETKSTADETTIGQISQTTLDDFLQSMKDDVKKEKSKKILRKTIYMKVEYNHAGYGVTIPFMMPYSEDAYGIKSLIHTDSNDFPTSFYKTQKIGKVYKEDVDKELYWKYTMIPLIIEYRYDLDEYLYYFEYDNIDMDERKIQFNLFEPRLKGFVDLVRKENKDSDINGTSDD